MPARPCTCKKPRRGDPHTGAPHSAAGAPAPRTRRRPPGRRPFRHRHSGLAPRAAASTASLAQRKAPTARCRPPVASVGGACILQGGSGSRPGQRASAGERGARLPVWKAERAAAGGAMNVMRPLRDGCDQSRPRAREERYGRGYSCKIISASFSRHRRLARGQVHRQTEAPSRCR